MSNSSLGCLGDCWRLRIARLLFHSMLHPPRRALPLLNANSWDVEMAVEKNLISRNTLTLSRRNPLFEP